MKRLDGNIAMITGGAGGIGKGMAMAFVKEGATVVIIDINEQLGLQTLKQLQEFAPESIFIQANLTEHDKLAALVNQVADKYGRIDVLVNNAHASKMSSIEETTQKEFDLSFNTGFYPTFYLMQAALPYLKESKGKIINFASSAGLHGDVNQVSYAVAKEAIRAATRVAANEFGPFGINVNLIAPIANSPGMIQWAEENPDYYNSMLSKIPLRRLGELEEDIGRVAVFLASTDSDYITGQTIMVDGGSTKLR
ncbi:NAD(P)-dependent dehydrogenase (short-subunit alcohol dehydrogenase family) [Paenibacillus shirakamiensis]|uniref:NAD(P)-dependent dehydrogenase (Short-subunit alcohol dehydrogenase family) n=1 Tax=Paenibacillus shirakamiensis TaxID=1265935 RepID=A0ABS4JIZ9_9BACL|nr:SDR family oxidoreductase [Paenibacillus shirakamiensis]MBP2001662.1 NAD(P)-dependent dehydrogenase (short-subunit alcohol dehydrogenase family) [Paenibacillus shirakamiensis]